METAARILAYPAEISPSTSTLGNSAGLPLGRRWMTRPSIICSGSGPITIAPWTSQTPQDWVGEKGSSGVWEVSGPEPEPARRPRLSQAHRPRGNSHRRSRPKQAGRLSTWTAGELAIGTPSRSWLLPGQCQRLDSAPQSPLLDSAMLCPRFQSGPKGPRFQSAPKGPCFQSSPKSPRFQSAPKCPRFQSAPKCPIEPLLSPRIFGGGG